MSVTTTVVGAVPRSTIQPEKVETKFDPRRWLAVACILTFSFGDVSIRLI